jgi:hypothetical protein
MLKLCKYSYMQNRVCRWVRHVSGLELASDTQL